MMAEMLLMLKRTVFLPKGSPGICTVREIKADIRRYELSAEEGNIYCSGEADLLIEYLSFAEGKQYPGYEAYEQSIAGGGSMWQALLTLPFELTERGTLPCPPLAGLSAGELEWFMVAPHALELTMELKLCWQEDDDVLPATPENAAVNPLVQPAAGWRKIALAEAEEKGGAASSLLEEAIWEVKGRNDERDRTNIKVLLGGERLNMEKDEKIIDMGVSDQGWRLTDMEEEAPLEEEIALEKETIVEDKIVVEEKITVEEEAVSAEEALKGGPVAEEEIIEQEEEQLLAEQAAGLCEPEMGKTKQAPGPVVMIQSLETPYQPQDLASEMLAGMVAEAAEAAPPPAGARRRVAGMPQLRVRAVKTEQAVSVTDYKVSYSIDTEGAKKQDE